MGNGGSMVAEAPVMVPVQHLVIAADADSVRSVEQALAADPTITTTAVYSTTELLGLLATLTPDVVLLDPCLPADSGSALSALRRLAPDLAVVELRADRSCCSNDQCAGTDGCLALEDSDLAHLPQLLRAAQERARRRILVRRREAALREREALPQQLFEHAPVAYHAIDADGHLLTVNDAWLALVGRSREDVLGTCLTDYLAPSHVSRFRQRLAACADFDPEQRIELELLRGDGSSVMVAFEARVERDGEGRLLRAHCLGHDLTAQREAEAALARAQRALRLKSACDWSMVRADHEAGVLQAACRSLAEAGGYRLVWVGLLGNPDVPAVTRRAAAGPLAHLLEAPRSVAHPGQRAAEQAVRERLPAVLADSVTAAAAPASEVRAALALPLLQQGQVLGALVVHGAQPTAFDADEISLLEALARETTFALTACRQRAQRDAALEALRESETRYTALFETTVTPMLLVDPDSGAIVDGNSAACRFYGYESERLRALRLTDLNTASPDQVHRSMRGVLDGERGVAWFRHRLASGELRDVEVHSSPIRFGGRSLVFSVVLDNTERRQAERAAIEGEQRYRTLFEDSPSAGFLIRDGRFVDANPAACRLFGVPREELLGRHVDDYSPPTQPDGRPSHEAAEAVFAEALRGGPQRLSWRHRRADGQLLDTQVSLTTVSLGGQQYVLASLLDLTPLREAEAERRVLEDMLRHAQKMEAVGRLAGGVAHDFNNLLTTINGYADFLLEVLAEDHPGREDLTEIRRAGDRATALTRQLLAFSRKQVLAPVSCDVNELLVDMTKMIRRLLPESIVVRTVLDPNLGRIHADPGQIEQVVMNLVVNAGDAMPEGGSLTITTANTTLADPPPPDLATLQPGSYVVLTVTDTGCGMDEVTRQRIFEPFFTTKAIGQGTGLGLATVYGIVTQSGGGIRCDSRPGRGTRFEVYLPNRAGGPAAVADAPAAQPRGGQESILLVEDDEGLRRLTRRTLEMAGYQVHEAPTGDAARHWLEQHDDELHLLLTDLVLPGLSGLALARHAAARRPGLRVLFISGYAPDGDAPDWPVLLKPFRPDDLAREVRRVLDS